MSKGMFITATGTEIGKTYVSGLLVKKLRNGGLNAGYYKPALSGAERGGDGCLTAGDARHVCETAGLEENPNNLVSYIYETPVSPHLAARIDKFSTGPIEMDKLLSDFAEAKTRFDFLTVEGSGGIVCPLRICEKDEKNIMLTDVIKAFGLPVLIVADAGLGTINASVLTAEYAKTRGISVKGFILNRYEQGCFLHEDNKKQIEELTGAPVIACVPPGASDLAIALDELTRFYEEV